MIVKAGWVHRQSNVLHSWKRCWLVLYQDGRAAYFDSPDKSQPEELIVLGGRLAIIHRGRNVPGNPDPPPLHSEDTMLWLGAFDGSKILLISAESSDDAAAWSLAFEQARAMAAQARAAAQPPPQYYYNQGAAPGMYPNPYPAAAGMGAYPYPQQPLTTTVIVERPYYADPYYGGGYYGGYGYGMGGGLMTGMALGSMMGMGMGMGFGHHCW